MRSFNAAVALGGFALLAGFAGPAECLALLPSLASTQPDTEKIEKLTKLIEKQKQAFSKEDEKAQERLVKEFDLLEKVIRSQRRLSPELRASKIEAIQAEKKAFVNKNVLPDSDEMLLSLLKYQQLRYEAYAPIAGSYKQLLELRLKLMNDDEVKKLIKEKEAYDKQVCGDMRLATNTNWVGKYHDGKNTVNCHLHIDKYEQTTLKGAVRQWGPGWTEGWKVEGAVDGMLVDFISTEIVEGKHRKLHYTGFLFDNRFFAKVTSITSRGNTPAGVILLRLQEK